MSARCVASVYPNIRIDNLSRNGLRVTRHLPRVPRVNRVTRHAQPVTRYAKRVYFALVSFESNLKRLEEIVAQLEAERLDLNTALRLFEEGIELLRLASEELGETETRVKELIERADGVLELRDLKV